MLGVVDLAALERVVDGHDEVGDLGAHDGQRAVKPPSSKPASRSPEVSPATIAILGNACAGSRKGTGAAGISHNAR